MKTNIQYTILQWTSQTSEPSRFSTHRLLTSFSPATRAVSRVSRHRTRSGLHDAAEDMALAKGKGNASVGFAMSSLAAATQGPEGVEHHLRLNS